MLTVLFSTIGSFIDEVSSSIIKFETLGKRESIYTAGFINMAFALTAFSGLALLRGSFVFDPASLPTFAARAFFEIIQIQLMLMAVMKTDRSTDAFVRNLTIPLLLIVDLVLGFTLSVYQVIGVVAVLTMIGIILAFHIVDAAGIGYSVMAAVNAVVTISLFKYNIDNFNSVEAEQMGMMFILLTYLFCAAYFIAKENPIYFLRKKLFLQQGLAHGTASVFASFAIFFGSPSVAITAKRAAAVLAGIISGHNYFQEKRLLAKLVVSGGLIAGLILLAL